MIAIGRVDTLPVLRTSSEGLLLGTEGEHVLLPHPHGPEGAEPGDEVEVFVYRDREGEAVATTARPYATVGEFAFLEVVHTTEAGAFLDWGLPKDLFVPHTLQYEQLAVGDRVVVAIFLDEQERVVASSTLSGHFDDDVAYLSESKRVDLLVYGFTELGAQVVVDGRHAGLVYDDWIHRDLQVGDELPGYVAKVRGDRRLDIRLRRAGQAGVDAAQQTILDELDARDGYLPLHDKSDPQAIRDALGMSKKKFKRAIGGLYKARLVDLESEGVRRVD